MMQKNTLCTYLKQIMAQSYEPRTIYMRCFDAFSKFKVNNKKAVMCIVRLTMTLKLLHRKDSPPWIRITAYIDSRPKKAVCDRLDHFNQLQMIHLEAKLVTKLI